MDSEKSAARRRARLLGVLLFALFFAAAAVIFTGLVLGTDIPTEKLLSPSVAKTLWNPSSSPPDPTVVHTKHLGGTPGYQVLEHVWVGNGTIYMYAPDRSKLPSKSRAVSGETGWEVFTHPTGERIEHAKNALKLGGTTIFVNDGADTSQWHYLSSYYHLIGEIFLGSVAAIASLPSKVGIPQVDARDWGERVPATPERFIIPWKAAEGWRDEEGLGEMVLRGIFGDKFLEPHDWAALSDPNNEHNGWVYLERVVITDRWASHRHNPLSEALNKMAASVFALPHSPFFFTPSRLTLLPHLGINFSPHRLAPSKLSTGEGVPKIVYVDRQGTDRKLDDESHMGIAVVLAELDALGLARVGHKKMERLTHVEQVEAVADADIIIGVHGDMLTHQLWMTEGGVVIELFPPDSYLPENQIIADVLHHEYIPVWHDVALTREEWEGLPRQHGHGALYDGTEVTVDKAYLRLLLEEVLQRMTDERGA
ncbi:hypothetical protein L202_05157 [Cryptococcus amylolentus CBS 6039]|uniref:Glycosyltransferase 61 catalytic domain-containing protein n=3 Tax=Cryptococcus amylolentus TaxID=104669 RepID=A0A1E3HM23_9TREE|nr:hypothetical protein L202_05157 [Cryptococcus amylolentus CBS 6039]ODN76491.1 hypothetical protein L202_05157 [Cryptococcus amylolentus CBS 6039]ODO04482.1 hypothetical protein I350_05084 [Cryptococcus amylolentus CBS 6273]